MSWAQFYKARVNNELYLNKFIENYNPLLNYIKINYHFGKVRNIIEEGVGIGTLPKAMAKYDSDFNPIMYLGKEICPRMRSMAKSNNLPDYVGIIDGDITDLTAPCTGFDLAVTHGVLEHFDDDTIIKILNKYVLNQLNNVHYVPLMEYRTPSFGDERLLSKYHWLGLINEALGQMKPFYNVKYTVYNNDKDMVFALERTSRLSTRLNNRWTFGPCVVKVKKINSE